MSTDVAKRFFDEVYKLPREQGWASNEHFTAHGTLIELSQKYRKRVDEIFRWIKTAGLLRRSRYRGLERRQAWGYFVVAAYNLLRMARLSL